MFDPMRDIPTTDDEARLALRFERTDLTADNLVGIFESLRSQGDEILKAYKYALLIHVISAAP